MWPFYKSLAFWQMPVPLRAYRDQALVTKGDANYRRLLGDRHWAHDTDFAELMGYGRGARRAPHVVGVSSAPRPTPRPRRRPPGKWLPPARGGAVSAVAINLCIHLSWLIRLAASVSVASTPVPR